MRSLGDNKLKINIIGLGYIGLPTALMLTKEDFEIVGTDFNYELISKLKNKTMRFSENGMEELLKKRVIEIFDLRRSMRRQMYI